MVDGERERGGTQPGSDLRGQVKCALIPGSIYFFYNLPLKRHQLSDGVRRILFFFFTHIDAITIRLLYRVEGQNWGFLSRLV